MLLRHAKSSWEDLALDDRDRPLNPRGKKAAPRMGKFMVREKLIPDLVLVSPALRAQETWRLCKAALPAGITVRTIRDIYDFGEGDALLQVIRNQGVAIPSLMLVGHNPSLEGLALALTGSDESGHLKRLKRKFPTAALAVIDLPVRRWADVVPGTGFLRSFTRPKDVE